MSRTEDIDAVVNAVELAMDDLGLGFSGNMTALILVLARSIARRSDTERYVAAAYAARGMADLQLAALFALPREELLNPPSTHTKG